MRLFNTKEASEMLGISTRMVHYYTQAGRLKILRKVGREYVYTKEQIQRFAELLKK